MFVGECDAGLGGFLAETLPVPPAAHIFQVAKRRETRVGKDCGVDPIGLEHRGMQCDYRAEAMTDQNGAFDVEGVHDREGVARQIGRREAALGHVAIAVTAQVVRRDPERLAERTHGLAQEPD